VASCPNLRHHQAMASEAGKIIGLYERHAEAWASERRGGRMEAAWLDQFLALVPHGAAVLDLGCGSGDPIGRYVVEKGYDVTGADSSPTLIDVCRSHLPAAEWIVADMRALSLGRRFAGIIAWDSFFHLAPEDQRRMFPVFKAHAMPKAALMFTSGPSESEAIGMMWGEPLYHASLDAAEYRALLDSSGFDVVSHRIEDPDCGSHTIWLAQCR
jgi:2-polyprenyl-3-methyl-5-hydroxy-6-metoxy-1,4-benzoquinol methylase